MPRVKLSCVIGCPGLKSSCREKGLLRMIFIKYSSLKSDTFFSLIFIPCFSGSMFLRVRFSSVQVLQGPVPLGSRFFRVQIQGPNLSPGFKSRLKEEATREIFRTKIFQNLRNFQNQTTCLISFFLKKVCVALITSLFK